MPEGGHATARQSQIACSQQALCLVNKQLGDVKDIHRSDRPQCH